MNYSPCPQETFCRWQDRSLKQSTVMRSCHGVKSMLCRRARGYKPEADGLSYINWGSLTYLMLCKLCSTSLENEVERQWSRQGSENRFEEAFPVVRVPRSWHNIREISLYLSGCHVWCSLYQVFQSEGKSSVWIKFHIGCPLWNLSS